MKAPGADFDFVVKRDEIVFFFDDSNDLFGSPSIFFRIPKGRRISLTVSPPHLFRPPAAVPSSRPHERYISRFAATRDNHLPSSVIYPPLILTALIQSFSYCVRENR
jgi:hypothetical protein